MSSSGYAAWSVTFGEQPTSTKWNILGSNDSSFNLGTGFEDGVIIARHIAAGAIGSPALATGVPVQIIQSLTGAVLTGTTVIPGDDTIPQNTEGDQYMTATITPKSATNRICVEAKLQLSASLAACDIIAALFQDSGANAIAAGWTTQANTTYKNLVTLVYDGVAGTTSATVFKVRAGIQTAGTLTLNGNAGARLMGGVMYSGFKITEYKV